MVPVYGMRCIADTGPLATIATAREPSDAAVLQQ